MLKFITNISCIFNLAVIFMLTSSLPVNDHQNKQDISTNITNNTAKIDASNLEEFITTLKLKYPKLNTAIIDRSFLNGTVTAFLNQCTVKDVLCMSYFDMLLRLADYLTEDSLKPFSQEIYQELVVNKFTGGSFCAEFTSVLPDEAYSNYTNLSMKMKDPTLCSNMCLIYNETAYIFNVKPICSITLSGYKYIAANLKKSNSSLPSNITNNTVNPHVKQVSSGINAASSPNLVPDVLSNAESVPNIEKSDANSANIKLPLVTANAKSTIVDIPLPNAPNQFQKDSVSQPPQENNAGVSGKSTVTNNAHPVNTDAINKNENIKVEDNGVDNKPASSIKIDTEKIADAVPNREVNSNLIPPPVNAATPTETPFISTANVLDGEIYNAYNDDENANQDDDSAEKNGETAMIKNNDRLEDVKPAPNVDAAYGKYTKQEENNEQLDPFTEDTDSNFFTYFMFVMVLCVMFYVVYHNKTKVLALVLEGRRGSHISRGVGRRKHTAAYRKLDSNLEEAITSSASGRTTQIIY